MEYFRIKVSGVKDHWTRIGDQGAGSRITGLESGSQSVGSGPQYFEEGSGIASCVLVDCDDVGLPTMPRALRKNHVLGNCNGGVSTICKPVSHARHASHARQP